MVKDGKKINELLNFVQPLLLSLQLGLESFHHSFTLHLNIWSLWAKRDQFSMKTSWWTGQGGTVFCLLWKGAFRLLFHGTPSSMPRGLLPHQAHLPNPVSSTVDAVRGSNPQPAFALHELDPGIFRVPKNFPGFPALGTCTAMAIANAEGLHVFTLEALWPQHFISLSWPCYLAERSFPWGSRIQSVSLGLSVIKKYGGEELHSWEEMVHLLAFWLKRSEKSIPWAKTWQWSSFSSKLIRTEYQPQEKGGFRYFSQRCAEKDCFFTGVRKVISLSL